MRRACSDSRGAPPRPPQPPVQAGAARVCSPCAAYVLKAGQHSRVAARPDCAEFMAGAWHLQHGTASMPPTGRHAAIATWHRRCMAVHGGAWQTHCGSVATLHPSRMHGSSMAAHGRQPTAAVAAAAGGGGECTLCVATAGGLGVVASSVRRVTVHASRPCSSCACTRADGGHTQTEHQEATRQPRSVQRQQQQQSAQQPPPPQQQQQPQQQPQSTQQQPQQQHVTRHNFAAVLPELAAALRSADFVSLDAEFTGLHAEPPGLIDRYDDADGRYRRIARAASEFAVLQLGVAAFSRRRDGDGDDGGDGRGSGSGSEGGSCYVARTFNLWTFPRQMGTSTSTARFRCEAASLEFLAAQVRGFLAGFWRHRWSLWRRRCVVFGGVAGVAGNAGA
uniref:Uncharacterized protein n=1 Tax=Chlamydomonas euryale TaxID=1486919 RepID=A0A7R9VGN2_9CHLO|mmetsp:Transcript_3362/g.9386  ORF Transcript_3362/g.9386 Transcript_3362/m.9386 type:complete len:392 (+) Transcript_3362:175-1350(+)